MELIAIHTAFSEADATLVKGLLEGAGILVVLRCTQIPGYATLLGEWGDVLVPEDRAREARQLIAGYLASQREEDRP